MIFEFLSHELNGQIWPIDSIIELIYIHLMYCTYLSTERARHWLRPECTVLDLR